MCNSVKIKTKGRINKGIVPYSQLQQEFIDRDYTLLSSKNEYISNGIKLRYLCNKHKDVGELQITYYHFRDGEGCPLCGREKTIAGHLLTLDKEYDQKLCESKGFRYFDTCRKNGRITIQFYCKKHKELGLQNMTKANMERDIKGCQYCACKHLPNWYVKQLVQEKLPLVNMITKYQGMNKYAYFYCVKHHLSFKTLVKNILNGHNNCPECAKEIQKERSMLTSEEVLDRVKKSNPYITIVNIEDYKGLYSKLLVRCNRCFRTWQSPPRSLFVNGTKCPFCELMTKGERMVNYVLEQNNIDHLPQYIIPNCKDKRVLPFDNSILDNNGSLLGLIEYHGEQHYHPVKYFGGKEKYQATKKRDRIKTSYCITHNIPLLTIPYWDYDNILLLVTDFYSDIVTSKNCTH